MSDSNQDQKEPVLAVDAGDADVSIAIFDGQGLLRGKGRGGLALPLARGVYTVRTTLVGQTKDTVIVHLNGKPKEAALPKIDSPVPRAVVPGVSAGALEASAESSRSTVARVLGGG